MIGLKRAGMIDMESNTTLVQRFPAHEAVPGIRGGPFASVIVLHDIYGLNGQIRNFTNRLAHDGFYAAAPNFYSHPFSTAPGAPPWMSAIVETSFGLRDREEAKARAVGLPDARALEFLEAALGHLSVVSDADPARVGLVGFGMGGRFAFLAACRFPAAIRAAVIYAAPGIASPWSARPVESMPILQFESLRAPLLFFYGGSDAEAPEEERTAVERVLSAGAKRFEIVRFPEAGHDFFNEEDAEAYRAGPARQAREKVVRFLKDSLGAR